PLIVEIRSAEDGYLVVVAGLGRIEDQAFFNVGVFLALLEAPEPEAVEVADFFGAGEFVARYVREVALFPVCASWE
ncbi:TPA: hypothetical protein ACKP6X_006416, partial [Pseudomonas aeruginosa]